MADEAFRHWLREAERRYLADLTRPELGRALRVLGATYVHRRETLAGGKALEGRGKRAAFALYYAPLHFLTVRAIAREVHEPDETRSSLPTPDGPARPVIDIGCGTGAAGAAWALETGAPVSGLDVSAWAVGEACWTYATLGVKGRARRGSIESLALPSTPSTLLAAFVINELPATVRSQALDRLTAAARAGHSVVVIEPIARTTTPWWPEWERSFSPLGGRSREWRFRADLPPLLRDLDKSAGLTHRELTARSLTTFRA
jgi:hypothetical protein